MEFYFQSNSVMNSLKCPKSKSLSHCLTELFPIYRNKHWTIRRWNNRFVDPPFHRIILKIEGFVIHEPTANNWHRCIAPQTCSHANKHLFYSYPFVPGSSVKCHILPFLFCVNLNLQRAKLKTIKVLVGWM